MNLDKIFSIPYFFKGIIMVIILILYNFLLFRLFMRLLNFSLLVLWLFLFLSRSVYWYIWTFFIFAIIPIIVKFILLFLYFLLFLLWTTFIFSYFTKCLSWNIFFLPFWFLLLLNCCRFLGLYIAVFLTILALAIVILIELLL